MSNLAVTRYHDIDAFLKETETYLQQHEIKNTFVLITAYQIQKARKDESYYCGAVWNDKHDLIFAIVAQNNGFLFASSLSDENHSEAIGLLIGNLLEASITIKGLHGYQPVLDTLRDSIETQSSMTFVKKFATLSYELREVKWPSQAKEIAQAEPTSLRIASSTLDDRDILRQWTYNFIQDAFDDPKVITQSVDSICHDMIASKGLYFMCINGVPVSMAWKVRPLRYGTSLAYVYTPSEHRNKGYGATCVAMASEAILKDSEYITLFVDINRDPTNNLYTRVGYKYFGEAGRLILP
ncbi:acetyltransferase [Mucor ambiguus]|uniref:Acetyltransferase n=1 Tax=Mucor ambiguus TaxID=91626 RepID=A0A0C9M8L6_9FUNG|nr:acetyltransferase [Mucor ambiguus]